MANLLTKINGLSIFIFWGESMSTTLKTTKTDVLLSLLDRAIDKDVKHINTCLEHGVKEERTIRNTPSDEI